MKKQFTALLLVFFIVIFNTVAFTATTAPLEVSSPSAWAEDSILALKETREISHFRFKDYQDAITKEDLAYYATRLIEALSQSTITIDDKIYFKDTLDSSSYKATTLGLLRGTDSHAFEPNKTITRETFIVTIMSALKLGNIQLNGPSEITFADDALISPSAKETIYSAKANGLITGYNFDPQAETTTEYCMSIINHILQSKQFDSFNYIEQVTDPSLYPDESGYSDLNVFNYSYYGNVENGLPYGHGIATLGNMQWETIYNGVTSTDLKISGVMKIIKNGSVMAFSNGKSKKMFYSNGTTYDGTFDENQKFHGHGIYTDANGVTYEGTFTNGNLNGLFELKGPYQKNYYYYLGALKNGRPNGHGVMIEPPRNPLLIPGVLFEVGNRTFDGQWNDGHFTGPGQLTLQSNDGATYTITGTFENAEAVGTCELVVNYSYGVYTYNGQFKNNAPSYSSGAFTSVFIDNEGNDKSAWFAERKNSEIDRILETFPQD